MKLLSLPTPITPFGSWIQKDRASDNFTWPKNSFVINFKQIIVKIKPMELQILCLICFRRVKPGKTTHKLKDIGFSLDCRFARLMLACWVLVFLLLAYSGTWHQNTKCLSAGYMYCHRYVSFEICSESSGVAKISTKSALNLYF